MKKKLAIFVFGLLLSTTARAQQRPVTGSVTDENGLNAKLLKFEFEHPNSNVPASIFELYID